MVLSEVELRDEAELEGILRREPTQIEEGFRIIAKQPRTSEGRRLDLLGVDREGVLTVVELKITVDANQLGQALDYYDWVVERFDWIKHNLPDESVVVRDQMPQIFLIAPDFDPKLVTFAKYLREDVNVRLLRYVALAVGEKKDVHIKCLDVQIPPVSAVEGPPPKFEDQLSYIQDSKIRDAYARIREELDQFSNEEPSIRGWGVSFYKNGRKFADINPRREAFTIGWKDEEKGWDWGTFRSYEDAEQVIKNKIPDALRIAEQRRKK